MKSRCAPISSGSRKANRKDGRSTIGCKRSFSSPPPTGTSPFGTERSGHRPICLADRCPAAAGRTLPLAASREPMRSAPVGRSWRGPSATSRWRVEALRLRGQRFDGDMGGREVFIWLTRKFEPPFGPLASNAHFWSWPPSDVMREVFFSSVTESKNS